MDLKELKKRYNKYNRERINIFNLYCLEYKFISLEYYGYFFLMTFFMI